MAFWFLQFHTRSFFQMKNIWLTSVFDAFGYFHFTEQINCDTFGHRTELAQTWLFSLNLFFHVRDYALTWAFGAIFTPPENVDEKYLILLGFLRSLGLNFGYYLREYSSNRIKWSQASQNRAETQTFYLHNSFNQRTFQRSIYWSFHFAKWAHHLLAFLQWATRQKFKYNFE